jgi:uncharacterized Zn finger protein (UPF0148 family)
MSGFRSYPTPPYLKIPYRRCPICGRLVKNFFIHTKKEDHQKLRITWEEERRKLEEEYSKRYSGSNSKIRGNPGFLTFLNQRSWELAIEKLSRVTNHG